MARFKEVEKVKDLFISQKRDKRGNHFGFVHFGSDINRKVVEEKPCKKMELPNVTVSTPERLTVTPMILVEMTRGSAFG